MRTRILLGSFKNSQRVRRNAVQCAKRSKMKLLIFSLCVAAAVADVSHILPNGKDESHAQIVEQSLDISPEGEYLWSLQTDNGIAAGAKAALVNVNPDGPSQSVQGQASWTSPEGEQINLQYIADENGYQPQGSHLPTPPPIPEAILRALEYIRAHPPPPEK